MVTCEIADDGNASSESTCCAEQRANQQKSDEVSRAGHVQSVDTVKIIDAWWIPVGSLGGMAVARNWTPMPMRSLVPEQISVSSTPIPLYSRPPSMTPLPDQSVVRLRRGMICSGHPGSAHRTS